MIKPVDSPEPLDRPAKPYVQQRYEVDLRDGAIGDPDVRDYNAYSFYDKTFVTTNVLLAKAVSDDINEAKIRDLQATIIRNTEQLRSLTGTK